MKITKDVLEKFRKDFANTVKDLEKQYGVSIKLGGITYEESSFTASLKVESPDTGKVNWNNYCRYYNFSQDDFGKTFKDGSHTLKIVGINISAKKFPIQVMRDDGKSMSYSAGYVHEAMK